MSGFIGAGESYELCLTNQTPVILEVDTQNGTCTIMFAFSVLRIWEPSFDRVLSPFYPSSKCFMRKSGFYNACVPYSNETMADEQIVTCQFRRMKGTMRNREGMPDGSVHQVSFEEATGILAALKERSESLKALDLSGHDLPECSSSKSYARRRV